MTNLDIFNPTKVRALFEKLQADLNEAMTNEGAKDCRIEDLEKALFEFGQCKGSCPAWGRPRPDLCTCGYVAAFKGAYPLPYEFTPIKAGES